MSLENINMEYTQAHRDLVHASMMIEVRHNYACGLEVENDEQRNDIEPTTTHFFFNSPDGQNGELFYRLREQGYRSSGYNAPYNWAVSKNGVRISYTEGDIYLSIINKEL